MRLLARLPLVALLLFLTITGGASASPEGAQRDPLRSLRRALSEAGAPELMADQETQLNTLVADFRAALPDEIDETLEAARAAFDAAILAGDQAAAEAQAAIIAARTAALSNARLSAEATFSIAALAVLRTGAQLDPLIARFGNDRVLNLIGSLIGRPFGGGRRGPGFGGR